MRILLTGHKGYLGTVMAPLLQAEGHEVIGLDSDLFEHCTFGEDMPSLPEIKKDIRDVTARELKGFEAVIHLAALFNDPLGDLNPELTSHINYLASVRIAHLQQLLNSGRLDKNLRWVVPD